MSNLVNYAQEELTRAGLFDPDSDYEGMLGEAALAIVTLFASQGHSGSSAAMVTDIVTRLMQYKPLTPLTYEPDEWIDQSEACGGEPMWKNKRDFKVFSYDGGKTHHSLDDLEPALGEVNWRAIAEQAVEALRTTREYVAPKVLLYANEGWSWYDATVAYTNAVNIADGVSPDKEES